MTKSKVQIDESVACDLGLVLSTHTTTVREIAEQPDDVMCLIFAFEQGDYVCYDLVALWREIDGMRIKIPKFQSHPTIEDRLRRRLYKRFYVAGLNSLTPIKLKTVEEFHRRLPFELGNLDNCHTALIVTEPAMGLRAKPLLFNRKRISYERPVEHEILCE